MRGHLHGVYAHDVGDNQIVLPDGLVLKAHPPTAAYPSTWRGSTSNQVVFGLVIGMAIALVAELVIAPITLINALAPFDGSFPKATATVLARTDFFAEHQYQCRLDLDYSAAGEQHRQSADLWIKCPWGPKVGDQVAVTVNPADAADVVVQGYDSARARLPSATGFGALCILCPTLVGFGAVAAVYGRVRRLAARELVWRQVTARVRGFPAPPSSIDMPIALEAEDCAGTPRVFVVTIRGANPWRNPYGIGDTLEVALVADGNQEALLATPDDPSPRVVALSVPNRFELRALDLPDV